MLPGIFVSLAALINSEALVSGLILPINPDDITKAGILSI